MGSLVDRLVDRTGPIRIVECRRCGTTLDAATDTCPYCGPDTDVVSYRFD